MRRTWERDKKGNSDDSSECLKMVKVGIFRRIWSSYKNAHNKKPGEVVHGATGFKSVQQ